MGLTSDTYNVLAQKVQVFTYGFCKKATGYLQLVPMSLTLRKVIKIIFG